MLVQFLGPHLYDRSLSCQFESRPHLYDRSSSCHVSLVSGTAPIRSVISLSCQFSFWDRTYTIGHYRVSLSRGRTHIDRPFLYQFVFSLSRDRTHIVRLFILPIRSVRRPGLCFCMTFRVTFPDLAFRAIVHTPPDIFVSRHVSSILGI